MTNNYFKNYQETLDTIKDCGGIAVVTNLGITLNGTNIDTIMVNEFDKIKYYAGNPTDEDDKYWEELLPTEEEENDILVDFNDLF